MIFRPATSKSDSYNLLKTFLQSSVFWFLLLYLIPNIIHALELTFFSIHMPSFPHVGWILFVIMGSLGLYSGYTMSRIGKGTPLPLDCPRELVVQGPYRIVRNPMAIAGIGQCIASGLILGSWLVIGYALAGSVLWHYIVRPSEEADLLMRHGTSFELYQKSVKCWWPSYKMSKR